MKVLVTRPEPDATALAATLRAAGHTPLIEPLITVQPIEAALSLNGVSVIVFTSGNGVRAFAERVTQLDLTVWRDLPVYAVGDQTAARARAIGFKMVKSASGTVEDLARRIISQVPPTAGRLLHVSGADIAGDLAGSLTAAGFQLDHVRLYEAVPAKSLSAATVAALQAGTIEGVLLFSPRTARIFATLLESGAQRIDVSTLTAFCLSQAVADAVRDVPLAGRIVAAHPDQTTLLATLPIADPTEADKAATISPKSRPKEASVSTEPTPPFTPSIAQPDKAPPGKAPSAAVTPAAMRGAAAPNTAAKPPGSQSSGAQPPGSTPPRSTAAASAPAGSQGGGRRWAAVAVIVGLFVICAGAAAYWVPTLIPLLRQSLGGGDANTASAPAAPTPAPAAQTPAAQAPAPQAGQPQPSLADLAQRLQTLETAVTGRASRDSVTTVQKDLAAQQAALAELARKLDGSGVQGLSDAVQALIADQRRLAVSVAELSQHVDKLEGQGAGQASAARTDQVLLLASGQLREALAGSGPYDAPVAVLRAVAPDDADLGRSLQVLERHARTGIRSRALLIDDFAALEPTILLPAPIAGDSWAQRALQRVEGLISIRRVDGGNSGTGTTAAPAGTPDRAVAGAEAALKAGDLAGAISALQALQGPQAQAAVGWLAEARNRIEAERAANDVTAALTQRLGKSSDAKSIDGGKPADGTKPVDGTKPAESRP
ncbi:MAG TPA: uroporphyrinogen-III synthase [Stellaceae bacterium]|nr:uroporphyrinogen-III synthase [Stellaceae bacterium]